MYEQSAARIRAEHLQIISEVCALNRFAYNQAYVTGKI
jgi:hypothetical protein